jgi:phosphate starvation-inducible protein PhoH and related proteins
MQSILINDMVEDPIQEVTKVKIKNKVRVKGNKKPKNSVIIPNDLRPSVSNDVMPLSGASTMCRGVVAVAKHNNFKLINHLTPKKGAAKISPKNSQQQKYINLLQKSQPYILIASGPAGCGKTLLATHIGVQKLQEGLVNKIVITRPAVSVDESHGFLPGSLEDKMNPWIRPVYDVLLLHFGKSQIDDMIRNSIIEISPLAYMRGRTFSNAWIIFEEAQNSTCSQFKMVLTRMGENSKLVITGDLNQHDRGYEENGLSDFIKRIVHSQPEPEIMHIDFHEEHVERHPVIPTILKMYI